MRASWAVPLFLSLSILGGASFSACGGGDDASDSRLTAAAANPIVADWVGIVGEGFVQARSIVPGGTDLHTFQPTPSDVRAIADADVVFLIGAGLEGAFEGTVRANAAGPVIELSEGLALSPLAEEQEEEDEPGHGDFDPHIWMDIDLAIAAVERIRDELSALDPDHGGTYSANAAAYTESLRLLDAEIASMLAPLPAERRLLVTFHDAYGYFAARYGLTILGFVVENADEEPSAAQIADLISEMKSAAIDRIYIEPQFSARVVTQVASETGAEVRTIPSDALDRDYPTYVELMRAIAKGVSE